MSTDIVRRHGRLWPVLALVLLAGVAVGGYFLWARFFQRKAAAAPKPGPEFPTVELVEGVPDTIRVPADVRKSLGIAEPWVVTAPSRGRQLVMPGSLQLDPTTIGRVRTRFNAEVTSIEKVKERVGINGTTALVERELRPGDYVKEGAPLAVVWSIDVGGKKSDLVDALVQWKLDRERLEARTKLWREGNLPRDTLDQTRRDVITDRNAVERAERTLRAWRVPDDEIKEAAREADEILKREGMRDEEKERLWARSVITAPRSGVIVERNVGVGEYVADNTVNLFVIADPSRMLVVANPPEDHLKGLLNLPPHLRRWSVKAAGAPEGLGGPIDEVSYLLDPNLHTAVVKGHIANPAVPGPAPRPVRWWAPERPRYTLRAGQFVTATVEMEPARGVVEVPMTALMEDGRQSYVFVQPDPRKPEYRLRRVLVTLRTEDLAYVRSELTPEERRLTPEEEALKVPPPEPLPGDGKTAILRTGALELRAALEDLLSKAGTRR
jgi:cobalt-zinc-cadmium efflux system membrane fusion protein